MQSAKHVILPSCVYYYAISSDSSNLQVFGLLSKKLMCVFKHIQSFSFSCVVHKDVIFKIRQNNVTGNLVSILNNFLKFIKQRVVFNGQLSLWLSIEVGVPYGSLFFFLGSLF